MTESELTALDIATLAGMIAGGAVSPVEVMQAYLDRIERADGRYHAYISVYPERALAHARRAEAAVAGGTPRGRLHGVPVAIKDLFEVAGMRRTCGSRIVREEAADRSATSVARLEAAGAIVIGLLNLHELAYGPTGVNPHFDTARNPWNLDAVCGGSSSGAGCAVAASLAAGALGTDTGGSIRIPAALCGVVGLKQTYGLASRHGIYPLCLGLDHGGPLARTVRDAALLLQCIAGEDENDPSTRGARPGDYLAGLEAGIEGVRVGVPRGFFFDDLHPEVEAAVQAALRRLEELGARVEAIDLPFAQEAARAWNTLALAEAWARHAPHVRDEADRLAPDVQARLRLGESISAGEVVAAGWSRERVQREMAAVLREVDLLATPTCPIPAVPVATGTVRIGDRDVEGVRVLGRLTRLAALTGQPAISLPCGFTSDGLPIGLQLTGGWFEEAALLAAAHAYEQATPWHERRPRLDQAPEST